MTVLHKRIWTKAQIGCHALGIPNYYSIAGRIVSDAEVKNPRQTAGKCDFL